MLAPAELKKLHNKQRKARRKAERESAQAAANAPKQQHNRPCPHHDAPDDAPQLEELIPDKLARVNTFVCAKVIGIC